MHFDRIFGKLIPRSISLILLTLFYLFLCMIPWIVELDTHANIFESKLQTTQINVLTAVSMKGSNFFYITSFVEHVSDPANQEMRVVDTIEKALPLGVTLGHVSGCQIPCALGHHPINSSWLPSKEPAVAVPKEMDELFCGRLPLLSKKGKPRSPVG